MDLAGKVSLVTGASGGIGEALARALVAEGGKVVAFARRSSELNRLVAELGESAVGVVGDVVNEDDLAKAVKMAIDNFGGLDILVNNAGVAVMAKLSTVKRKDLERGFDVNVVGPVLAYQAALPAIRSRGGGMIVNVSSGFSLNPHATMGVYAATKAALNVLSGSMRKEVAGENITVMTVHPGFIANDFGANTIFAEDVDADSRKAPRTVERTSEDAARDMVGAMKADAEVFRSNETQPLVAAL